MNSEYCGCRHDAGLSLVCALQVGYYRDLNASVLCERVSTACGPSGSSLSVTHCSLASSNFLFPKHATG
jgi:hypothetical protein